MLLSAFMHTNYTKVYSWYVYQSNIAMMCALLIGWKWVKNESIALKILKYSSDFLILSMFSFTAIIVHDKEKEYNLYKLLHKFTPWLFERQVLVLESPINKNSCAPETLEEVLFQVYYNTAVENKEPILLCRTQFTNE